MIKVEDEDKGVKEIFLSGPRLSHKAFRYNFDVYITTLALNAVRDLSSCYASPSTSKVSIWNKWLSYNDELLRRGYWTTPLNVCSFNGFYFSLEMAFGVPGSRESYYVLITSSGVKHYTLTPDDQLYLDHKIIRDTWIESFKDECKGKNNAHYVTRCGVC